MKGKDSIKETTTKSHAEHNKKLCKCLNREQNNQYWSYWYLYGALYALAKDTI